MSSKAVITFYDDLGLILIIVLACCVAYRNPRLVNTFFIGLGFLFLLFSLFSFVVLLVLTTHPGWKTGVTLTPYDLYSTRSRMCLFSIPVTSALAQALIFAFLAQFNSYQLGPPVHRLFCSSSFSTQLSIFYLNSRPGSIC